MKRRHCTVADVMTTRVHVASPTTQFKLLVRLIQENRISAVPIVDQRGVPIGVVSESDLLVKERRSQLESDADLLHLRRLRRERTKAQGLVASDVMTSPPITVSEDELLGDAARLMQERNVRRLVVVNERGKIAGVVSRSDLLRVFLRSDEELLRDIVDDLLPTLMLSSEPVGVDVRDNVVTLQGEVDRKSDAEILGRWTRELDGVVDVVNRLTHRWDDTTGSAVGAS
ncbi:MAG TPA: CBS domain-containing protein [Candidatus Dormibacteraeota bacterium]|nr:CBS domain-containing protein [Candidatus Dormibacteraeota bacterium]